MLRVIIRGSSIVQDRFVACRRRTTARRNDPGRAADGAWGLPDPPDRLPGALGPASSRTDVSGRAKCRSGVAGDRLCGVPAAGSSGGAMAPGRGPGPGKTGSDSLRQRYRARDSGGRSHVCRDPLFPDFAAVLAALVRPRLRHVFQLLTPGLVFASDGAVLARAIEAEVPADARLVVTKNPPRRG